MSSLSTDRLKAIHDFLREKNPKETTLSDVVSLAEIATGATRRFLDEFDMIYRELRTIADYIESLKREISLLKAHEINRKRIPIAGLELGAICRATEEATNAIMECAEVVMSADSRDPAAYKALVEDKMMIIFEGCAFQDITGQRIAKVMETLQLIDARVSRFATAVAAKDAEEYSSEAERLAEERKRQLLLNGPQLDGPQTSQSDVDALFP